MDFLTGGGAAVGKVGFMGIEIGESVSIVGAYGKESRLGPSEGREHDKGGCTNVSQLLEEST